MTDTLLDYDPNDTGDIPRPIGETARIITADDRERLIGENTENLGQYLRPDAPFMTTVRFAAGDRIGRETTDYPTIGILPDPGSGQPTLVYGMGRTIDMEETVVHGIRYSLAGPQSPPGRRERGRAAGVLVTAPTPAERADQIRRAFDDGLATRAEAIAELRTLFDITEVGAGDLLDDKRMPSERYAAQRPGILGGAR
jgi:hypothetical protein